MKHVTFLIAIFIIIAWPSVAQDETFTVVEESAIPAEGMEAFYKRVSQKMKYPAEAKRKGIEGRVFVEFVVEKDGSLSNVKVIKGIGGGCDEEAVKIVASSPKWTPGKQKGVPVRQKIVLPLVFQLGDPDKAANDDPDTADYYVKLNSGKKIRGSSVKYKARPFGKSHLEVDGERYEYTQVKAYQNQDGYFLKAKPMNSYSTKPEFYHRELAGDRISTYSITKTYYNAGAPGYGAGVGVGTWTTAKVGYYTKDHSSLKKLNFTNLKLDLGDNQGSMIKLKEVNKIRTLQGVMIGVGVATFIGGIAATAKSAKENDLLAPSERDVSLSPLLFVGPIIASITLWSGKGAKDKKMNEAIQLYNK